MKARIDNVDGFRTAHDVRKLRACAGCHGVGMDAQMIQIDDERWHTRCFRVKRGFLAVLALPESQRAKFRLNDLSVREMRQLIGTFSSYVPQKGGWVRA